MRLGSRGLHRSIGTRTRRLSSVRSTATPASTLPTVRETSMARICVGVRLCCDDVTHVAAPAVALQHGGPTISRRSHSFMHQATTTLHHHTHCFASRMSRNASKRIGKWIRRQHKHTSPLTKLLSICSTCDLLHGANVW